MIGRSNMKQASCNQGAITHRIPLFLQEAIAKWPTRGDFRASRAGGRGNRPPPPWRFPPRASRIAAAAKTHAGFPYSKGNRPSSRYSLVSNTPMISIRSSLTELERSHQIRAAVLDCYVLAIKKIDHY